MKAFTSNKTQYINVNNLDVTSLVTYKNYQYIENGVKGKYFIIKPIYLIQRSREDSFSEA